MQSPRAHRDDDAQATQAAFNRLSTVATLDLGFDSTRGSEAYMAATDSRGRLLQVDPRQDARIRAQNSQRQAQIQASGNQFVSKWNDHGIFDGGSEDQGNLFDGQGHRYQPTPGPVRGSTPRGRGGRGYTPPSSRGHGSTPVNPHLRGPAPVGLRPRADSPSRYGTIRDLGGRRERQPTPPRHGGVVRQPPARQTPKLTLSRASDIIHSKDSGNNQDATHLQVPPRFSRAGSLGGNKDYSKNQDAIRPQVPPHVSRYANRPNPSGNKLITQMRLQSVRLTQPVRPTQPVHPTQPVRPVQPRSETDMNQEKLDFLWAAAHRADCDFLETSMVAQKTDGPAIARAKILTIDSALTSSKASKIVIKLGPQWVTMHDHVRWCFVTKAFWIAFGGGDEQTKKLAKVTANFTEFGKLWQDARDAINEANVITKANHLIPTSKQKWKDMDKLDVLEEAIKRTEEAANAAEVEERDAAIAAGEMDGESGLIAHITGRMADMSIRVDTSIEQTVEHRQPDSADTQTYGTTTTISGPGIQPVSGPVQTHPGANLHITQGSINTGLVNVSVFDLPTGMDVTLAVELEGDSPPLTRNLLESYVKALKLVTESLARGDAYFQEVVESSDSSESSL